MIKERYVNLEVAKLLRDKGFNESCYTFYCDIDDEIGYFDEGSDYDNTSFSWMIPDEEEKCAVAPTQQRACDWIEATFNIAIDVWVGIIGYGVSISYALRDPNIASNDINHKDEMPCGDNSDGSWSSKELAYNEALKYVLTNLV